MKRYEKPRVRVFAATAVLLRGYLFGKNLDFNLQGLWG
jgi:hypothetical protein